jgi:SET domain-containing protein
MKKELKNFYLNIFFYFIIIYVYMYKSKLIKHLENDIYCRIGVSKISGVGVIAIKNIPKGINPFKTLSTEKEKIIELNTNDIKKVDNQVKKILNDFFGSDKKNRYDILASGPNNINISFYMNHSDKPNIDIVPSKKDDYLVFISNRNIKKGEELTINYNVYDEYDVYEKN